MCNVSRVFFVCLFLIGSMGGLQKPFQPGIFRISLRLVV